MDIKRVTSALLGFPLVVLVLMAGNKYVVDVFLAGIALLGMQEYFNAVSKKVKPVRWVGYLSCIPIAFLHIVPSEYLWQAIVYEIIAIVFVLFLNVIFSSMKITLEDIAYTFLGIIYVALFILFIALIRGLEKGRLMIWYAIIAAWGTDTMAYLVGKTLKLGKHKVSKISPKKSIEGCIAGTVGALIIAIVYTIAINYWFDVNYSYLYISIMTIILSIISQMGDFAASTIKRYVDIKDFSNLIPGHGGMLDRIDSLLFLSPFAYIFVSML